MPPVPVKQRIEPELPASPAEDVSEIITKISVDIQKWTMATKDEEVPEKPLLRGVEESPKKPVVVPHRKPSVEQADSAPQKIAGEPLLNWCQRISKDYKSVAVKDFTWVVSMM